MGRCDFRCVVVLVKSGETLRGRLDGIRSANAVHCRTGCKLGAIGRRGDRQLGVFSAVVVAVACLPLQSGPLLGSTMFAGEISTAMNVVSRSRAWKQSVTVGWAGSECAQHGQRYNGLRACAQVRRWGTCSQFSSRCPGLSTYPVVACWLFVSRSQTWQLACAREHRTSRVRLGRVLSAARSRCALRHPRRVHSICLLATSCVN